MNTITIKKTIAREGLIVIGVLMLLGIALTLEYRENGKRNNFEKGSRVAELVEPNPTVLGKPPKTGMALIDPYDASTLNPTGIRVMIQSPVDLIRMQQTLRKDFPKLRNPQFVELDQQNKGVSIKYYYDSNGDRIAFTDYGIVVVLILLVYPVYWLVRFIYWSIWTLR
jgi:hypothetical protein